MMATKKRKRTRYERLNKAQRAACVEWMRERLYAEFEPEQLTDRFMEDLCTEYQLPSIQNVYWSLGHCQGDGVAFEGQIDLQDWRAHESELNDLLLHLEGVAVLAGEAPDEEEVYCICCKVENRDHHYCHWNSMSLEFDWSYRDFGEICEPLVKAVEDWVERRIKAISREMEKDGYDYIDAESSEEYAIELLNDHPDLVAEWLETEGDDE